MRTTREPDVARNHAGRANSAAPDEAEVMMRRIYWMSRHAPLPAQKRELQRIFGEVQIVEDKKPFGSTEELVQRFRDSSCSDIVFVGPESVLRRLVDIGLRPIWAKMSPVETFTDPDCETVSRQFIWRFVGFERVVRYEFIKEPL
jgi:hypothetical protein